MGEIIARNMLIEIINKIIIVASSWLFALLYFLHPFFETKKHQISNFMKIPPAKDELFHVDRQTWRNLMVASRSFANAPKNPVI